MDSQKIENQLNLSLGINPEEREKSVNLNVGFDSSENTFELIIRYTGNLDRVRGLSENVTELLGGYAVINILYERIQLLASLEEVLFIEMPKSLYFAVEKGIRASCMEDVKGSCRVDDIIGTSEYRGEKLTGAGCLLGIIDSGIDYYNDLFKDEEGNTKILMLWDQKGDSKLNRYPKGYSEGVLYTYEDINGALERERGGGVERYDFVRARDVSGHGTSVAGIMAQIACEARIIAVKLGGELREGKFNSRNSQLMQAIDFCVKIANQYGMPIAINLSLGNNYGSHDGDSLLARYIDTVSEIGRNVIVAGMGNNGFARKHGSGRVDINDRTNIREIVAGDYEVSVTLQMWKSYADIFNVEIISPAGDTTGVIPAMRGAYRYRLGSTQVYVYVGEPSPYSVSQEMYIELIGVDDYVQAGIWQMIITGIKIVAGRYDIWLLGENVSQDTGFLVSDENVTLTVPATSREAISVGAYDSNSLTYADFSGRGYTRNNEDVKPDIAAPGVNIECIVPGGKGLRSGTSFAAPFVTGAAVLLMEWGIIRGNDRFMYGQKIKASLIRGARMLPGMEEVPDRRVGYGVLCLSDSF